MLHRVTRAALSIILGVGLVVVMTPASADVGTACEWTPRVGPDDVNVGAPDGSAYYWVYPYEAVPGTKLEIRGVYPDARYFSFQVLGLRVPPVVFGPVTASVYDAEIEPNKNSENPFRGAVTKPNGPERYKVTVLFSPKPATPAPNTIYANDGAGGVVWGGALWYRVYIPTDAASPTGSVTLPTVNWTTLDGQTLKAGNGCGTDLPPTGEPVRDAMADNDFPAPVPSADGSAQPVWRRHFTGGGAQQVAYLTTTIQRRDGNMVVVRGKAPSFPDTTGGEPVYTAGQLRYWSMCQYWLDSLVECAADHETSLDGSGYYTYVVSDPSQRPSNATPANGVTWIPWGATNEGGEPVSVKAGLWLRHMLPDPSFTHAVQNVATNTADPRPTMGDYFPEAVYCDKATFEAGGWQGCFGNP